MAFKEMLFKGKRVFVEVDEKGEPFVENGRARMKYRIEDDKFYGPSVGNLEETGKAATCGTGGIAKKKSPKTVVRAAGGGIVAYTDGACSGNPGPAGLGYVIVYPGGKCVQAGEPLGRATNNIAELTAILRVLDRIDDSSNDIVIYSDSEYAIGVLSRGWKAKANQELIGRIKKAMSRFPKLRLQKVAGHAGVPENELVDELARRAAETQTLVG